MSSLLAFEASEPGSLLEVTLLVALALKCLASFYVLFLSSGTLVCEGMLGEVCVCVLWGVIGGQLLCDRTIPKDVCTFLVWFRTML